MNAPAYSWRIQQKNPQGTFMTELFVKEALDYSIRMVRRNLQQLEDFPELAKDGQWALVPGGGWVGGHWTGLLWLAYAHTQDPDLLAAARSWTERLAPRQHDLSTHDLGFLFELSYILGAKLTGDDSLKAPAIQASRSLIRRFNEKGGYIQAWRPLDAAPPWRGRAIIDTLMNLYLLFWASQETGDANFARIANAHAKTALQRQVRQDGSTAHVMDFNPDTGEFIKQDTHQGLSPTSCWARGQAWAVHGYADAYRWTHNETYLNASRSLAEYMLRRSPPDHVPFWDYDSPLIPNDVRDSSAGSILASGMLNLATLENDPAKARRWRAEAVTLLTSLWENYSSRGTADPSILIHATRSKPAGMMDSGLIYGDYYFVEALTRLAAPEKLPL
jgi:unsaturated chondroitin disaccharide hydrolase